MHQPAAPVVGAVGRSHNSAIVKNYDVSKSLALKSIICKYLIYKIKENIIYENLFVKCIFIRIYSCMIFLFN